MFDIYTTTLPKSIENRKFHVNTKLSMLLKSDTLVRDEMIYLRKNKDNKPHITELR